MESVPHLSETEWEVMRVVWGRHPITAAETIAHLTRQDPFCHPKTIRTFLARLVRTGCSTMNRRGGVTPTDRG